MLCCLRNLFIRVSEGNVMHIQIIFIHIHVPKNVRFYQVDHLAELKFSVFQR